MKSYRLPFCTALLAAAVSCGAWAQASVQSELVAQKIVRSASGEESRVPADSARPGDVIEYAGTYRNAGKVRAEQLLATIPVPSGTTYLASSAQPAGAQASTDGTRFAPMPLMRQVRQPDGSTRQEPVPLAEYRYVRWNLGTLPPAAERVVRLRVRIDAAAAGASTQP